MTRILELLACAALLAAAAAQVWIPLGHPVPGEFSDSIDYLVFADYFRAAFSGQLTQNLVSFFAVTRFPPLFPLVLSALGAGAQASLAAYWLTALCMIASFALAAIWLARECRSVAIGAALAACFALNPGVFLLSLNPVSEALFLPLLLVALLWSQRAERDRGSLLAFAAFVGLLPLCRMAGVAVIIGAALWLARRPARSRLERIVAVIIMLAPATIWLAYRKLMPIAHSYADALTPQNLLSTFGGWHGLLLEQPLRMALGYVDSFSPWTDPPVTLVAVVALLFVSGLVLRLARWTLDSLALAVYLALVWCWPYPAEMGRLLALSLPMFFVCTWESTRWLSERIASLHPSASAIATLFVVAGTAVGSLPFAIESFERARAPVDAELEPFRRSASFFAEPGRATAFDLLELQARIAALMDETASVVKPGDCVFTFHPTTLFVHAPAVDIRAMPYPPQAGVPLREQFSACRYVLVTAQSSLQNSEPLLYPLREAREWLRPALVSRSKLGGGEVIAAALLRKLD